MRLKKQTEQPSVININIATLNVNNAPAIKKETEQPSISFNLNDEEREAVQIAYDKKCLELSHPIAEYSKSAFIKEHILFVLRELNKKDKSGKNEGPDNQGVFPPSSTPLGGHFFGQRHESIFLLQASVENPLGCIPACLLIILPDPQGLLHDSLSLPIGTKG